MMRTGFDQNFVIVTAISQNGVIGHEGKLPWSIEEDMLHFKKLTTGRTLIMGRKTFQSIGKPLQGRFNIVVTSQRDLGVPPAPNLFLTKGVNLRKILAYKPECQKEELIVIGGKQIYQEFLGLASDIHMTIINRDFEGDTVFPSLDKNEWEVMGGDSKICLERNSQTPVEVDFVHYRRKAIVIH